jgi:hypothetical protein
MILIKKITKFKDIWKFFSLMLSLMNKKTHICKERSKWEEIQLLLGRKFGC